MSASRSEPVKWTYDDYARLPPDLQRHEIIDGRHFVSPSPNTYHQQVSARLHLQLHALIEAPGHGTVLYAPMDIVLSRHDVVQPDLIAVLKARRQIVTQANIQGAPDLAIEILSPSTRRLDRQHKHALYERAGIAEYWIVDPEAHVVEQYVLAAEGYGLPRRESERVELHVLPGAVVDLTKAW
jgi:Uma2 family endonuclease